MTNLSQDTRRRAGNRRVHPWPQEVIATARIIKRLGHSDPEARNRLTVRLAETLHEMGHRFNEAALFDLCGFDPAVGGPGNDDPATWRGALQS